MPLHELFAVTHNSPQYNESTRQGMFYAESWLLTHFLMAVAILLQSPFRAIHHAAPCRPAAGKGIHQRAGNDIAGDGNRTAPLFGTRRIQAG